MFDWIGSFKFFKYFMELSDINKFVATVLISTTGMICGTVYLTGQNTKELKSRNREWQRRVDNTNVILNDFILKYAKEAKDAQDKANRKLDMLTEIRNR